MGAFYMVFILIGVALLQFIFYWLYNRVFHPFQILMTDPDPKEPSPIPLIVIEAVNDQDDGNHDGDGAAEQAENGAAQQVANGAAELEQAEDCAAEQVENCAEMANIEVEPLM